MGIAGRGPKIKIQDVEERPKGHARFTSSTFLASTSSVVSDLQLVAGGFTRAGNQRLPESVTKEQQKETEGFAEWIIRHCHAARAMTSP